MRFTKLIMISALAAAISFSGLSGEVYAKNETTNKQQQKVVTENDIRTKYFPLFKQLESEAKSSLNKLVSDALSGKGSFSEIIAKGRQLREDITLKFNQLLEEMENELVAAGLNTDLVSEAEEEFSNQSLIQKEKIRKKFDQ
ncbi:hypothetical protein [Ammoniphilus sp. 3BR4]|uniref:hypothetical protein n=1 Tax=Ammoniphilus sp. 3BR4 TaxID=3158265 RepID=UPI00346733DF